MMTLLNTMCSKFFLFSRKSWGKTRTIIKQIGEVLDFVYRLKEQSGSKIYLGKDSSSGDRALFFKQICTTVGDIYINRNFKTPQSLE